MAEDPAKIFDRSLIAQRRARYEEQAQHFGFLRAFADRQLNERLDVVTRDFEAKAELQHENIDNEIEALPYSEHSMDLIRSNLMLHTVNDLPGLLLQIRKALKPDGLFVAAMFGGESLYQLRKCLMDAEMELKGGASPRVFPFIDKQQAGALMQRAGFALPVIDSEMVTVTYQNMFKLMADLRGMGENNILHARDRRNPGKAFFMRAAELYQERYAEDDGRICATFEMIFLLGWSPHESQQKPLKPGSAQNRLADALDTEEIKTGETP